MHTVFAGFTGLISMIRSTGTAGHIMILSTIHHGTIRHGHGEEAMECMIPGIAGTGATTGTAHIQVGVGATPIQATDGDILTRTMDGVADITDTIIIQP